MSKDEILVDDTGTTTGHDDERQHRPRSTLACRLRPGKVLRNEPDRIARFQALCESLHRNDPFTTRVVDLYTNAGRAHGRGRPLGKSLSHTNTCVTHLELPESIVCDANLFVDVGEIQDLLLFVKRSKSLRSFHFVGYGVEGPCVSETEALWIDAVAESPYIEKVRLDSCWQHFFPDQMLRLFRAPQSQLKHLDIKMCPHEYHDLYFNAINNMSTLETLELRGFDNSTTTPPELVAEMIRNLPSPVRLRSLALQVANGLSTPPFAITEAIATFVQRNTCLTSFSLCHHFDEKGMQCFLDYGLSRNQSITRLTWHECHMTDEAIAAFVTYMRERNGIRTNGTITAFCYQHSCPSKIPLSRLIVGPWGSCLESLDLSCGHPIKGCSWDQVEEFPC